MSQPRKLRCTVEALTDHGGRVYTVDLAPQSPAPSFRPGQFLHLTVDDYDPSGFWPESRVFSIASSPSERGRLRICYSVKGRYTIKMEQALQPGREVWVKLPYGEFIIDDSTEAVLLAGGTGISAFTAFVESLKPERTKPVWLIYGAREPGLLLFREMLLDRLAKVPAFQLLFFTEAGTESFSREVAPAPRPPACFPGRISLDSFWPQLSGVEKKTFYLAGPPIMLSTLGAQLKARGVAPEQVRVDAWE
jgi:ferredoxin-NADP reductase